MFYKSTSGGIIPAREVVSLGFMLLSIFAFSTAGVIQHIFPKYEFCKIIEPDFDPMDFDPRDFDTTTKCERKQSIATKFFAALR